MEQLGHCPVMPEFNYIQYNPNRLDNLDNSCYPETLIGQGPALPLSPPIEQTRPVWAEHRMMSKYVC